MSQHIYPARVDGHGVQVQIGWDKPMQEFYLVIEYDTPIPDLANRGEVLEYLYSNLSDMVLRLKPERATDLGYFAQVLAGLGLPPIESVMNEVRRDRMHNAVNRVVRYDAQGVVQSQTKYG